MPALREPSLAVSRRWSPIRGAGAAHSEPEAATAGASRPLIVLGIDALDWGYVDAHRARCPPSPRGPCSPPLRSIFPPDSIPAWTTIFTGRGPADHGCLDSIDYLDRTP